MSVGSVRHSVRLVALLNGFGLNAADFSNQPPKAVAAVLRKEYYKLAKERHPDVVPDNQKADAAKRFVRLQSDFSEAVKLLEAGIVPRMPAASSSAGPANYSGQMHAPPSAWQSYDQGSNGSLRTEEFDLKTRMKGRAVFWSGLFFFFIFMREFLVWSAGQGFAWTAPKDANIFWIRRLKDEWAEDAKKAQDTVAATKPAPKKEKEPAGKKSEKATRNVSEFYQKRGISSVRRKTEPRGCGGASL